MGVRQNGRRCIGIVSRSLVGETAKERGRKAGGFESLAGEIAGERSREAGVDFQIREAQYNCVVSRTS